jgi:hypothetical protein
MPHYADRRERMIVILDRTILKFKWHINVPRGTN